MLKGGLSIYECGNSLFLHLNILNVIMKKIVFTLALLVAAISLQAQNLQLHFDPRHALHSDSFEKNYFTATFEMFKPDKWGSTFMFVDLDFNQSRGNIGTAYLELARDFKMGKCPVMLHAEFNGGVGKTSDSFGFSIANAYLAGLSYNKQIGAVNVGTYVAYKYNAFKRVSNDVQWTVTWGANFFDNKFTVSGFMDLWTQNKVEDHSSDSNKKKVILLTEPQFWYNATSNLSVGTEIEISNNFLTGMKKTMVNPTIAAKWNF